MSTIFRLDSAIRTEGSVSRAVASTLEAAFVDAHPDATVIRRDVGLEPVSSTAWATSSSAGFTPADARTPDQVAAAAVATELAEELLGAEAYVFATSLYNFGVSQHVKAWVDLVMTEPRFSPVNPSPIAGRPAYLVVARGGAYGPGTPRDGWDYATGWLVRIFGEVWGLDLEVIEAELTLADHNPAMFELRDLAAEKLELAHGSAGEHGKRLADRLVLTAKG